MVKSLQARTVTLCDLVDDFSLQFVEDDQFFYEWQEYFLEICEQEKELLDKVKAVFFNLVTYPLLLEKPVREAIISPLLFLAGFYLPPFYERLERLGT